MGAAGACRLSLPSPDNLHVYGNGDAFHLKAQTVEQIRHRGFARDLPLLAVHDNSHDQISETPAPCSRKIADEKNRSPEGRGPENPKGRFSSIPFFFLEPASLRWHYPDQVPRVASHRRLSDFPPLAGTAETIIPP